MASQRLKLKVVNKDKKILKSKVTELAYTRFNIVFNRVIEISDGFLVITKNEIDAEKVMKEEAVAMFKQHGYDVIIPPVYRARRTIFVRKLDEMILENEEKDLIQEINDKNEWAKVQSLIKINGKNIKMTFADTSMVEKALEKGLLCCNMSITPNQINRENFTEITTCFKCYKYNTHTTNECKKPTTLCSCCCSPDHHWRECTSTIKKCLNCGENHHTLASFCSFKKRAIEEKKKALEKGSQKQTYSAATINGSVARAVPTATTTLQLQDGMDSKIVSCILMSHFHNLAEPGQFGHYFSRIMAANGLPKIVVPDVTDSFRLINALQNAGVVQSTDTTQAPKETQKVNTPAAKKQLFADANESPAKADDCCAVATYAAATSESTDTDAAITPLNKRSRLDIMQTREFTNSAAKDQKRCKQERMLVQKQNDLDTPQNSKKEVTPTRAVKRSGSLKRTPIRDRNFESSDETRMLALMSLKEDVIESMEIRYYAQSEIDEQGFDSKLPYELWNGSAKISFIDPFKQFNHPILNNLTENDIKFLFSRNRIPHKFVEVFDKLEEGEFRRRRAGLRSPSK